MLEPFIVGCEVATEDDALELALGTPLELWLGVADESAEERAARLAAARDILAEEPELCDRAEALIGEALMHVVTSQPSARSAVCSVSVLLGGEAA
ncbi:hypothetical protein [Streptomyces reniochalinae]|uniref:hypothetical protein n=1 Tax=Streptomyces reniochalinae TaxID=2250578 RepID=UPI0015F074DD|nr:hypothetical protein [Streptomyces reniochalinae]